MAFFPGALAGLALLTLTGCASIHLEQVGKGEAPTVLGPPVRTNTTPLQPALACMAQELDAYRSTPLVIAVGDIRDYTGKYNINEGNAITQGGALMVYSALGELGDRIRIADRYNLEPAQMELTFLNQRVLGDGHDHSLVQGATKKMVPWIPYYGGTVIASDYFITGGITELNYNVQTGGVQFQINELGPKARVFTESIGIDLQIVNTRTLMVVKTISLEKQITGFEVGFNIFRFFGSDLYDLNIGNKSQEPLQLGVRSTLYDGVLRLVSAVSHVPYAPCLARVHDWIPRAPEAKERASVAVPAPLPAPPLPPKAAAAPASAALTPTRRAAPAIMAQLAALSTELAAKDEWHDLNRRIPELLAGQQPTFVRVSKNGHLFWRVRTGTFASLAAARAFCRRVRAQGLACLVADF